MELKFLWLQEVTESGRVGMRRVPGEQNLANGKSWRDIDDLIRGGGLFGWRTRGAQKKHALLLLPIGRSRHTHRYTTLCCRVNWEPMFGITVLIFLGASFYLFSSLFRMGCHSKEDGCDGRLVQASQSNASRCPSRWNECNSGLSCQCLRCGGVVPT